jgi:lipoate-protein ligase A
MNWRLIDTDIADPYFVTAADEAICQARMENKIWNTLHFYRRSHATISVGRSRRIKDEVDMEECLKNNVKIVRRASGGGSIFTDNKCLIYSLIFDAKGEKSSHIFEKVCTCIVDSLRKLNINAYYKPPNDILLNGKKISGSAQIKKRTIVQIHGTILVDTDLEIMSKVLKNTRGVSTIRREIGHSPSFNTLKHTLRKGFEGCFSTKMEKTSLSPFEKHLIDILLKERYLNESWNIR